MSQLHNLGLSQSDLITAQGPVFSALQSPRHDPLRDPVTGRVTARAMLEIRLGYHSGPSLKYELPEFRISAVEELPETVVVFAIVSNKPVMLEDDRQMYPSDKLISKIRLLTP